MTLDVLCKVVDNYGDIGVVYRLARALSELDPLLALRIVVDDLRAFSLLEPLVNPDLDVQKVRGWTVVDWKGPAAADAGNYVAVYDTATPRIVLECFACGRPKWFEAMMFDDGGGTPRTIVNIEYLSAEPYADEFHLLPSLTRSGSVRKHMFMPGFTPGTGGLILDSAFVAAKARCSDPAGCARERNSLLAGADLGLLPVDGLSPDTAVGMFWTLVFSYERNYAHIVADLAAYNAKRPVLVMVASGKSEPCFMRAWEGAGRPFHVLRLPFLPQETWDRLLLVSDFLIVRGEDSMARAALSGRPFLWHAYPQAEAHQLVKVKALLERMRPHFDPQDFQAVEDAYIAFNDRLTDGCSVEGNECITPLLKAGTGLIQGFSSFSNDLISNGNLASALMTFIYKIV
jgi:uncharacterized repeat protein (TIGR03837 family)